MTFTKAILLVGLAALAGCAHRADEAPRLDVVEAGIPQLQQALAEGRVTSRELVLAYLARIGLQQRRLNAVASVNPRALDEADALDRERAQGHLRGPLHGIPIALKDNIHTLELPTTGGAIAFQGLLAPYEATLARMLRERGAIVLAKTVMTELANWVAGAPTPMPANYSALFGYGLNPYDPRLDPRPGFDDGRGALPTGGSSSGIGTAASLWAASVGTETSGSILSPAQQTGLVGIKPTVGRISRHGIIPITADQDTAGPMARTVTDAAILLGELERSAPDPKDAATQRCAAPPVHDYRPFLRRGALRGARIGIPRAFFYERIAVPGVSTPRGGLEPEQAQLMAQAIEVLRSEGAEVVDPADIPSVVNPELESNFLRWSVCTSPRGRDERCSIVFKYGMKRDFNAWLASLGPQAPVADLTELRGFNSNRAAARGSLKYGQSLLDISDGIDLVADRPRYEADRAKDLLLTGAQGIDAVLAQHRLDAILFPGVAGASLSARPGYPTVTVPFGFVRLSPTPPWPAGFEAPRTPFGVSFAAGACSEPRLVALAYAFEQITQRRVAPPL
jgi:amidase